MKVQDRPLQRLRPVRTNGIDLSIHTQISFAPPDAPTVHRTIAYGKRTPEGRSAAIG
jgi:hypothetical protein